MRAQRDLPHPKPRLVEDSIVFRSSRSFECIDVTDPMQRGVESAGIVQGACLVFSTHTTCSVLVNEWERGVIEDLDRALGRLIPRDIYYMHDDLNHRSEKREINEPANGAAHVAHMLMGASSQMVPIKGGTLALGKWQRIFAVELDGPRDRRLHLQVLGADGITRPVAS
jgi:secondary thiamine-phosphate synthase enzyme